MSRYIDFSTAQWELSKGLLPDPAEVKRNPPFFSPASWHELEDKDYFDFANWARDVRFGYWMQAAVDWGQELEDFGLAVLYPELCEGILVDMIRSCRKWIEGRTDGYVYVLESPPYHKIGRSQDPQGRIRQLKIQLPNPVEVIKLIPSDDHVTAEWFLHDLFADQRSNGEWFQLHDASIDIVTSLERIDMHDVVAHGAVDHMPDSIHERIRRHS